jgi:hypothetical protein
MNVTHERWTRKRWSRAISLGVFGVGLICACQLVAAQEDDTRSQSQATTDAASESQIVIKTGSQLPDTYPRGVYNVRLLATGGVPSLHWKVEKGALPPGIRLREDGELIGSAERTGEFQFTLAVRDSSRQAVQKEFSIRVRSALVLNWKSPAHVNGNRIEGSVEVSNTTPDDIDLTFIVLAVASDNGRATAIGYQHFSLPHGANEQELPFGETLPHGGYVVHVDVVGEVAPKNVIYRERMQTPQLQVTVGP